MANKFSSNLHVDSEECIDLVHKCFLGFSRSGSIFQIASMQIIFYNIINNLNRSSIDNFDLVLSIDATAHILYITHIVARLCHRNKCVAGICSSPEPGVVVDHH